MPAASAVCRPILPIRGANFGQMLVLVDGVRLNDAQSGHHNGDIPVPLDAIDRIEILHGPGSSLFGADAFGGTINVITRRDTAPASGVLQLGGVGSPIASITRRGFLWQGAGRSGSRAAPCGKSWRRQSTGRRASWSSAASPRPASARTPPLGERTGLLASYLWKDFGANGFYGNAPSHEWTNQALFAVDHRIGIAAGWQLQANTSYRTHGDHFIFDVRRPGVSENRHRSHAAIGAIRGSRGVGDRGSVTLGLDAGSDWIRSTNLGNHDIQRISGFSEWRHAPVANVQLDASLRLDRYTEFGTAWSPSLGVGWWPSTAIRLRASTGRAFRVPTFTERYYSDPANLARPDVGPEHAWAWESGIDIFPSDRSTFGATVFGRLDHDVIDWLRPSVADRWQTYNIRDVDTVGIEVTARRTLTDGSFVQAGYTTLDVDAAAVTQLSKYVLDYAPHSFVAAASIVLPAALRVAPRLEYKRRTRSTGTSDYAVFDVRVSRQFGLYEIRLEGTNLSDATYQEVLGVAMPGRGASISLAYRP